MTDYLVAISIGPVQSLIEAGRSSQDLWCGSWLLSEVSRAVALSLHEEQSDCLIFPNPKNPDIDLQPQDPDSDSQIEVEANIANVVRAVIQVDDISQVRDIVENAKQAAEARLMQILDTIRHKKLESFTIDWARFEQQKNGILDTYAAWVKFEAGQYGKASERLGKLLAARKQTKDFKPIQDTKSGLFKSTLDGANNTLTEQVNNKEYQHQLRLSQGEELDILGLVKRSAGHFEQFTPFSRVVVEPWLSSLSSEQLNTLQSNYQPFVKAGLATTVKGNEDRYQAFPYDGEYLFTSRIEQEKDLEKGTKKALLDCLSTIGKESGSPMTYGVLLKADGDRMGELLSKAEGKQQSKAISKALHEFATSVRKTLQDHGGHAIYAGGDDVLAFVPLAQAMTCAKQLADDFKEKMKVIAAELKLSEALYPTLSVGLAIGHFVQPMRQLRARVIAAEKHAKGNKEHKPRNALAIHLGIRSGHEITWRCRWDDDETLNALTDFTHAFAQGWMPTRIMQEVREMAVHLKWTTGQKELAGIRESELERMLARAEFNVSVEQSGKTPEQIKESKKAALDKLKSQLRAQASGSLDELANLLILARWLSAKTTADIGGEE
ncbi:type III-B CRISPR-associated protein Cas10/Cmr2 [Vibrio cholerae]|uniref:type III-B CRISPR-associated protein Cas10/Cmr2 n=1 Tax=Vibrio cholerae TaxID=666 RepID=UPI000BA919DE|nr:type III-B CRISPR-associated protein Cas10/Cmr2 [Vibrio cholerae]PAS35850.1 type III-B CRISPR-associated protein Cas10/Cmr2 [Vibrio cholerae]